jgi:hypothetical protein
MLYERVLMWSLNWFLPKPTELQEKGLYFVTLLLFLAVVTCIVGSACRLLGAHVPAYLMLLHTVAFGGMLFIVRKCRTEKHFSATVITVIAGVDSRATTHPAELPGFTNTTHPLYPAIH